MTAAGAPLVLTLGDPAGVGPEIAVAAWRALSVSGPVFAVIGDADAVRAQGAPVHEITVASDAAAVFGRALPVLHRPVRAAVTPGAPEPANA
ncbi:MAG: 4-hydroxythreonine-4-phosphate dehydrogenase, partial [Caulobacterales bacterium]|nr:4-hydroxythreonine-4-phosphate dehydrogenase [Caulobacterales bacterium]